MKNACNAEVRSAWAENFAQDSSSFPISPSASPLASGGAFYELFAGTAELTKHAKSSASFDSCLSFDVDPKWSPDVEINLEKPGEFEQWYLQHIQTGGTLAHSV